jgi:archaeosortase C (PEF-CTERM variant)
MDKSEKTLLAFYLSLFLVGISISMSWAYYTSRLLGLSLIVISTILLYRMYLKIHKSDSSEAFVRLDLTAYGLFLIMSDLLFNFIIHDNIGPFDLGLIVAGLFIIFINLFGSKLFKLDMNIIKFTTYFVFVSVLTFGILFYGMEHIFGSNGDNNPLYNLFAYFVVLISSFFLNLIQPTVVYQNAINFNGFSIFVGYGCSGIESFAIYLSALVAYFFSFSNLSKKDFLLYSIIGVIALYLMNVVRIIILVLIGYYFDTELMMVFHTHLGWIMFVFGMAIFWYFAINKQTS